MNDEEPLEGQTTVDEVIAGETGEPAPTIETPEDFEIAMRHEIEAMQPQGVELTDPRSQHVADMDAIYGNLRGHRDALAKLKLVAHLSKAGVTGMPHLTSVLKDIENQEKAIEVLIGFALTIKDDEEAVVPVATKLEVAAR